MNNAEWFAAYLADYRDAQRHAEVRPEYLAVQLMEIREFAALLIGGTK